MVKAVVGANWGDEGKGKITDMLAREADIIMGSREEFDLTEKLICPGMTDEACATIYGHFSGEPTSIQEEEDEDIQVILADREECRRILAEEKVSITCAYQLMHFIGSEDPLAFLKEEKKNRR